MALYKSIESTSGATASYWRIVQAHYDYSGSVITFEAHGYLDETARRSGRAPLVRFEFTGLRPNADQKLHDLTITNMYDYMRSVLPGLDDGLGIQSLVFADAENV